jgi:hypothetical protein
MAKTLYDMTRDELVRVIQELTVENEELYNELEYYKKLIYTRTSVH